MGIFSALGIDGTTFADPDMITLAGVFWIILRWF
jgi:hypothetical protein